VASKENATAMHGEIPTNSAMESCPNFIHTVDGSEIPKNHRLDVKKNL